MYFIIIIFFPFNQQNNKCDEWIFLLFFFLSFKFALLLYFLLSWSIHIWNSGSSGQSHQQQSVVQRRWNSTLLTTGDELVVFDMVYYCNRPKPCHGQRQQHVSGYEEKDARAWPVLGVWAILQRRPKRSKRNSCGVFQSYGRWLVCCILIKSDGNNVTNNAISSCFYWLSIYRF